MAIALAATVSPEVRGAGPACALSAGWPSPSRAAAAEVVALVNRHRASLGLPALMVSPTLTDAAEWKSGHMNAGAYLGHGDLDYPAPGQVRSPGERIAACGYPGAVWGENVAYGQRSAAEVVAAWLGSAGHRANIENRGFAATGVGASPRGAAFVWTQEFGAVVDPGSTAGAPPPVPAPAPAPRSAAVPAATAVLRADAFRAGPRPARPRRGVVALLRTVEVGGRVTGVRAWCAARAAGRTVPGARRTLTHANGGWVVRCAWRVPRWAAGRAVRLRVELASPAGTVARSATVAVRRR